MSLMYLPPPGHTRRGVLKKGLFGGVLLAMGGAGFLLSRPTLQIPLPPEGLLALSPNEYALLEAMARRLIAAPPGAPTVEQVRVAFHADRTVARLADEARVELRQLMGLFENGLTNFLLRAKPRPFTQMDAAEQDATLDDWQHSRLSLRRTGFQALRTLLMACYYGDPQTWAVVGYPGPPPGLHDPQAPQWRGGEAPRPPGNGVTPEAEPSPAEGDAGTGDQAVEAGQ